MLLTPRDYLSTFMKIGVIVLLAVGLVIATPVLQNEAVTDFAIEGNGPVFAGKLFPFVFITIACGALSGFHALIASGTTPKMVAKESQVRMIGYGGMLMESFVAISALIAASVIDQGLYFAMNSPAGATGGEPGTAAEFIRALGFTISPADLTSAAASIEEESLISRTGGAPTLAFGISLIFTEAFGGGLAAFWYHFAIMFEALFILTAVDAGTRVGRFMLQDTIGNVWPRYADLSWKPASWSASAVVVGLWGYMLYVGVTDPLGGINQLFPLFGISNQLLAAIALTLCVTLMFKHGKAKWAWVPGIALAWDLTTTMTASWQKVFSSDPKIGYFEQRSVYQAALDDGELLAPATDMDQMQQIITNSTDERRPAGTVRVAHPHRRRSAPSPSGSRRRGAAGCRPPRSRTSPRTSSRRPTSSPPRTRRRRSAQYENSQRELAGSRSTAMRTAVRRAGRGIRWYLKQVTGEAKWDEYLDRCRSEDVAAHVAPGLRTTPGRAQGEQPACPMLLTPSPLKPNDTRTHELFRSGRSVRRQSVCATRCSRRP